MSQADQILPPAPPPRRTGRLVIGVALGLVIGGSAGTLLVGPALSRALAAEDGPAAAAVRDSAAWDVGPGSVYVLDDLLLNPAGSNGTRFLLATLAVEVAGEEVSTKLRAADPVVRDAVLRVLERKTVQELADVGARDRIRDELRAAVAALLPEGAVGQVYLSQFLLQ